MFDKITLFRAPSFESGLVGYLEILRLSSLQEFMTTSAGGWTVIRPVHGRIRWLASRNCICWRSI